MPTYSPFMLRDEALVWDGSVVQELLSEMKTVLENNLKIAEGLK